MKSTRPAARKRVTFMPLLMLEIRRYAPADQAAVVRLHDEALLAMGGATPGRRAHR